jgi:acyl-CoA hydrolase/membrane protease YdiL (CAAX protease family)
LSRYASRQPIITKCAVVALVPVVVGPQLVDGPGELAISILVVFALIGACVAAYAALSRAVALILVPRWRADTASTMESAAADAATGPSWPTGPNRLRLRHVLAALAVYMAAGVLVWFVAAIVVTMQLGPAEHAEAIARGLKAVLPIALPASIVAGYLAVLLALRRWGRQLGTKRVAEIIASRRGTSYQLLVGVLAGTALGVVTIALMPYVPYQPTSSDVIEEFLTAAGPGRWAWIISAVILAPPVEELMFRGVLLGGLAQTWSLRGAALVSGATFWLMHAPEWLRYWPAAVAIGLMTIIVTALRLRTRALGPSIVAHSAYNLMMAAAVFSVQPDGVPARGTEKTKWAQLAPGAAFCEDAAERRLGTPQHLGRATMVRSTLEPQRGITLRFLAEPGDVNFGGKVHGGAVMKWIDQVGYTCAAGWTGSYCVTVYIGGLHFLAPIHVGELVELRALVIRTGRTSLDIAVDVYASDPKSTERRRTGHCVIVFVALAPNGRPAPVPQWQPRNDLDRALEGYAVRLAELRKQMDSEMERHLGTVTAIERKPSRERA